MSTILLDSMALVWWYKSPALLSKKAYTAIGNQTTAVLVSAATAWEIATKVRKGKLPEAQTLIDRYDAYLEEQNFQSLSVSALHARLGGSLASPHKDPFDRLIAAQAQAEAVPVVTCDPAFQMLGVRIFW
jgi:PIN domain nuclease of toxin-antitoxin system